MKKTILPLVACFLVSFALFPVLKAGSRTAAAVHAGSATNDSVAAAESTVSINSAEALATNLYNSLDLKTIGLSFDALKYALKGYQHLVENGTLSNDEVLTVIDFSQPSSKKRQQRE